MLLNRGRWVTGKEKLPEGKDQADTMVRGSLVTHINLQTLPKNEMNGAMRARKASRSPNALLAVRYLKLHVNLQFTGVPDTGLTSVHILPDSFDKRFVR